MLVKSSPELGSAMLQKQYKMRLYC